MVHSRDTYGFKEVPIEPIIYANYIRYEKLYEICSPHFVSYNEKEILLFIDLYSLLLPLFRIDNKDSQLAITSCVINMAIHYRNFFKKNGIYAYIFLLYSPTMGQSNLKYVPEYNKHHIIDMLNNKKMYDSINQNLNLIGIITKYLPDIHFKLGTVETSVMAYDIINKLACKGFNRKAVFVTASQYAFQLVSSVADGLVIYKKRTKTGDDISYGVTIENAMKCVIEESKKKTIDKNYPCSWVAPFFSLCGLAQRDVRILFNYRTGLNILASIENSYEIISPETLYMAVERSGKLTDKFSINAIMLRFKCLDLNFQLAEYRVLPESQELAFMSQMNDYDQLLKINETYFKNNPLNLDLL